MRCWRPSRASKSKMSETAGHIRIRAQRVTRDPQTIRFILDAPVQEDQSARFDGPTNGAPLAQSLFGVTGVDHVLVEGRTILVSCTAGVAWDSLKAPVAAAIRAALAGSEMPLGSPRADMTMAAEQDAALLGEVTHLLDTRANPSIASHGGKVTVEAVTGGVVHLRMSGGCQGCASSALTLRRGVETMLRASLPGIRGVIDVTDHEAGTNPYYRDGAGKSPVFIRAVPKGVLSIVSGRIGVDPAFLGQRLGMKAEDVRAGLESGKITVERLPGAIEGNSCIVMRGPSRAWAAEVAPNGAASEVPPPRANDIRIAQRAEIATQVRRYLEGLPTNGELPSYGAISRGLGLSAPGSIRRITEALELTMHEDVQAGRPFIAARAVSRVARHCT